MKLKDIHNLLFDLDGTLVDSSGTITTCIEYALDKVGMTTINSTPIQTLIGAPLLDIFLNEFGLTQKQTDQAIYHYREHWDSRQQAGSQIYENIQDVLSELQETGYRLYIATVKPTSIAEKVLDDLSLRSYFNGVAGSSMDHERREKSRIIAHALQKFGLDPMRSIMIGDRRQDIAGARDNGLVAMAVTYGFGTREELYAAKPDHIVEHARDIASLLIN
jgi:phosphoglycolate phosphatase